MVITQPKAFDIALEFIFRQERKRTGERRAQLRMGAWRQLLWRLHPQIGPTLSDFIDNKLRKYQAEKQSLLSLLIDQRAICSICREPTKVLCVDHDHKTGHARGWLCRQCNAALGFLKENPRSFKRAMDYLAKPPIGKLLHKLRKKRLFQTTAESFPLLER